MKQLFLGIILVNGGAFTLGSYINGESSIIADFYHSLFQHEYGYYLQSQMFRPLFLLKYGIPSAINNDQLTAWQELDATARGYAYFNGTYNPSDFKDTNPSRWEFGLFLSPDWYYIPIINLFR